MALKNKTHDIDKASIVQRAPQQQVARASNEHERPLHPAIALKRATSAPPAALRPADILALQRTVGNRAVHRLLTGQAQSSQASESQSGQPIQTKLTIGAAGDKYEQEADRVARQVMSMYAQPASQSIQLASEKEEDELQRKPSAISITSLAQREMKLEEQRASSIQLQAAYGPMTAGPTVENAIQSARGGGQPLPDNFRARMERAFGADFSGVRAHTDAAADSLNRSLQARAFTTGPHLFFKRGEYNPDSHVGQELIAHELTHVVQQQGRAVQGQQQTERGCRGLDTKGHAQTSLTQPAPSINVIQRATSMDGPFDAAYADTLLTESQGRTARTKPGHALDHLLEDVYDKKGKAKQNKLKDASKVINERKTSTFYTSRAAMKNILVSFLTNNAVAAQLASMKGGAKNDYQDKEFKHDQIDALSIKPKDMFPVLPKKSKSSFLLIQTTNTAPMNLHLQTMFPPDQDVKE